MVDKKLFLLPGKINSDLYIYGFNVAERKYGNQMLYRPTLFEQKGLKSKASL